MGARYLADTHVLIWLLGRDAPKSGTATVLASTDNRIVVSAVSAFEIAYKVRIGKLDSAAALVARWAEGMRALAAEELPLTEAHASMAGSMVWEHRDPFDRMLAAQAQIEGLILVTADRQLRNAPGVAVLPW